MKSCHKVNAMRFVILPALNTRRISGLLAAQEIRAELIDTPSESPAQAGVQFFCFLMRRFVIFCYSLLLFAFPAHAETNRYANLSAEQAIQEIMRNSTGTVRVPNATLYVFDGATDKQIYHFSAGDAPSSQPIHIEAATLWISTAVILQLVEQKFLSLDDTTSKYLKDENGAMWSGNRGEITLRQLLTHTSGLYRDAGCLNYGAITLEQCSLKIYKDNKRDDWVKPSTTFDYGGTHLQIAARMAEVATQKSWNQLFNETIKQSLGFTLSARYTNGQDTAPTNNPSIAAGLWLALEDYFRFMRWINHKTVVEDKTVIGDSLFTQMEQNQIGTRTVEWSPFKGYTPVTHRYGFGTWVECVDKDCSTHRTSNLGLYGFYPWIDRKKNYYAVMVMRSKKASAKESAALVEAIRPYIEKRVEEWRMMQ
jgi:CubicO group peptidase (beta-lactamase class C family)